MGFQRKTINYSFQWSLLNPGRDNNQTTSLHNCFENTYWIIALLPVNKGFNAANSQVLFQMDTFYQVWWEL